MKNIIRTVTLLALAVIANILLVAATYAIDPLKVPFPDTPAPPGSQWSWVGRQMVVDGAPMSIKTFQYKGAESELISHFENVWKTQGHGAFRRNKIGPKQILSHETADFYTTIQYEIERDLITGTITVSTPLNQPVRKSKPFLKKPPGSTLISRIESDDYGVYSESQTLLSQKSVKFNARYFANQLKNKGWVTINSHCDTGSCVSHFQSSLGQLQISIKDIPGSHGNGSRILIHLIEQ